MGLKDLNSGNNKERRSGGEHPGSRDVEGAKISSGPQLQKKSGPVPEVQVTGNAKVGGGKGTFH